MRTLKHMILTGILVPLTFAYAMACDYSHFDLVSTTDLGGGQYEFVVTFCAGGGIGGADQNTYTWGVELVGPATFASFPATLASPQTGAIYAADASFAYGPEYLLYFLDSYTGTGFDAQSWTTSGGGYGPAGAYCKTFTLVTNGMPTQLRLMGAEAAGIAVEPYGCNGSPDMEISFDVAANAGATQSLCIGNTATLTATATGGTPPYSYAWSTGATTATISVSPTVNTTYTVTVTDANGHTDSDPVVVVTHPKPTVNAGTDKTITIGYGATCATLTGTATGGSSPYTYSWTGGGTSLTKTVCPTTTTTYTLTATDYYGCSNSDAAQVTVKDVRCGATLTKVYVCKMGTTKCISSGQVPSYLTNGWVLGACWMKLDDEVAMSSNPINIFPNPATTSAEIVFVMADDGEATIELYSLNGERFPLSDATVSGRAGEEISHVIALDNIPAGIYQVFVHTTNGQIMTEKLAVIR